MKSQIDSGDEKEEEIETELEARARIINNFLTSRQNCIVLKLDTGIHNNLSPFGFHFELDKQRYVKKIKEERRKKLTKWLHWAAVIHHKLGIRHLILIGLLVLYTVGGGVMFNAIESKYETEKLMTMILDLDHMITELTNKTLEIAYSNSSYELTFEETSVLITDYYKAMLQYEGRYSGTSLHKMENLQLHRTWRFESAVFYSMTLFTTIGYGTIACNTVAGQAMSLVYSAIGIPLMLVVLGDVGNLLLRMFTNIYGFFVYFKKRFLSKNRSKYGDDFDEDAEIELPTTITLLIIAAYLVLCAAIVHFFDWAEGAIEGLDMWRSFYFSTISFFTIGLGDVMPNNIHYSPFLAALFLIGLALVSMINSSFYTKMETSFFGVMNLLENQLEKIHREHHTHGYETFVHLSQLFKIPVFAVPNIPDVLDYVYDTKGNRSLGIQVDLMPEFSSTKTDEPVKSPMKRRKNTTASRQRVFSERERAPTLGVFSPNTDPVILKAGNLMGGLFVPTMKRWESGDV